MISRLFCFTLFIITFSAQAQFPISPNKLDENGKRTGFWTILLDSTFQKEVKSPDSVRYYRLLRYENGLPVGKVRDFFRNAQKQWEGTLLSLYPDVIDGEAISYHENGKIKYRVNYSKGKAHGKYQEYSINEKLKAEGMMKNDTAVGKWNYYEEDGFRWLEIDAQPNQRDVYTELHRNGNINRQGIKINNKKEGLWISHYEDGTLNSKSFYKNDKKHGLWEWFNANGVLEEKGQYLDDKKFGHWLVLQDGAGAKMKEGSYDSAGKETGKWTYYHTNGKVKSEGVMVNGSKEGIWNFYHDNGALDIICNLHRGLYEGERKRYRANGALEEVVMYVRDTIHGHFIAYYENGKVKAEGEKDMDVKIGAWKYYFESGELDGTETFRQGVLHGPVNNYYADGKIKDQSFYKDGKLDSLYTAYFPNGQLERTGMYKDGKREGYWHWYFSNGQLDSKYFYKDGLYEGPFITYYSNGAVWTTGSGVKGKMNGWTIRKYSNGNKIEEGLNLDGKGTGKWKAYDSLTGKVTSIWTYKKGKYHGKTRYFTAEGKNNGYAYYVNGFKETPYNIRDSVYKLIEIKAIDKAQAAVEWSKKVVKRDFDKSDKANAVPVYLQAYVLQYGRSDYNAALPVQQQYLNLIEKFESRASENYRSGLNDMANLYSKINRNDEAIKIYDTLLALTRNTTDLAKSYNVYLYNKATTLNTMGKYDEADQLLLDEIKLQEQKGKNHADAWAIRKTWVEFIYNWRNDYERSIPIIKELLKDVSATEPESDLALFCVERLAYSHNALTRRVGTIHWLKEYAQLAQKKKIPTPIRYFNNLGLLANNYTNMPYLDSAMLVFDKMNEFLTSNNLLNTEHEADLLDGKAEVYFKNYQYTEALNVWSKSQSILEELKLTRTDLYADVLRSKGMLYTNLDKMKEGIVLYEKGLQIDREINGEFGKGYVQSEIILASLYDDASEYTKATQVLESVLKKLGETPSPIQRANYANALNALADIKRDLNDYREAIRLNEKALTFLEADKNADIITYTDILRDISLDHRRLGELEIAETFLNKALNELEETLGKESLPYLNIRISLANYYNARLLYSDAEKIYTEAMKGFEKLFGKNHLRYIFAMRSLASCYLNQNEYQKSFALYSQYLPLAKAVAGIDSYDYLDGLENIAYLTHKIGTQTEAEKYYLECVLRAKNLYGETHPDYAYYIRLLAEFYFSNNNLPKAEEKSAIASAILRASAYGPKSTTYSRYIIVQANILSYRNKNKEAEELIREALAITSVNKENYLYDHISALEAAANFYQKLGQNNIAEKCLQEVVTLTEARSGKDFSYAVKSANLISQYYSSSKYHEVIQTGKELLTYFEGELSRDHYLILDVHNLMGLAALELHDFTAAAEHFNYCIEMRTLNKTTESADFAIYLNNLSISALALGQFKEAEELLDRAAAIRARLGIVYTGKSFAVINDNYAGLYQAWGKLEKAEKYWLEVSQALLQFARENFYFMSDEEKAQFWNEIKEDFEYFNTFAVLRSKQNPAILGEMYNNQLATKAILLSASNKIKKRILTSGDQAMINHYYEWVEARERLAQLYSATAAELKTKRMLIDSLEQLAKNSEKELNITSEDLNKDKGGQDKLTNWKEIQRVLAPNEAAVEIIRFRYFDRYLRDSVIYAALVLTAETKMNPKLVVIPNGDFLETRAIRFYKNAIAGKVEDDLSYKNFWLPIDALLVGKNRIYLSLDGVYNQLNLNTLQDANGKFLVEEKNLTILSNTKDLLVLKSRKATRVQLTTASLFGYPKYFIGRERVKSKTLNQKRDFDFGTLDDKDATGIADLPGTQIEIAQVKDILVSHQWDTKDYTDDNATEKALKSVEYPRVLHIATHGFFVEEDGAGANLGIDSDYARQNPLLRSGLLLSGAANFIQNNFRLEEENGILTAYEAANLNLDNTDLVVLSACETGKGEVQNGEGVYGLQRAFQTAGAQAIIMSLWKVDDAATQELMTAFYQNWMSGKLKAEAFRSAQLQLKSKYNHPYYWGAFVMMGN